MDDDDGGYDGPNIRPPQHRSGGGGAGDRDRRPHRPSSYRQRSSNRREGGGGGAAGGGGSRHPRDHRRDRGGGRDHRKRGGGHDQQGQQPQGQQRNRPRGGGGHPEPPGGGSGKVSSDLRHRLAGGGGGSRGHDQRSSRPPRPRNEVAEGRDHDHRANKGGQQQARGVERSGQESGRDMDEARKKRRQLEKEMAEIEQTLKRKRERSKERHKKRSKEESEEGSGSEESGSDDDEDDDEEEEEESGEDEEEVSGSEESGSEESGSGSGGGGGDTASEHSGATPDNVTEEDEGLEEGEHADSAPDEKEGEGEGAAAKAKRQKEEEEEEEEEEEHDEVHGRWGRSRSRSPVRGGGGRGGRRGGGRAGSETPSRSPTPRREDSRAQSRASQLSGDEGAGSAELGDALTPDNGANKALDDSLEKVDFRDALPPYLPSVSGCRSVEEFQCLNRIEEGTYGVVYRARDKRTNETVALKRLKMEREKEGFPITSLREINTLLISQHRNVVTVREIVVGSNMDKIYIVMDFVEHDMKSLMETMRKKRQVFLPGEVKCLMTQLLSAISHLHDNWILHRDLKSSNLLLSHNGVLKVGDFGLAREYGSPLQSYTSIVVTLWYRAPELLLGIKEYSTPIDVWSIGCIFGELLLMNPLFPGESEVDELNRIFKLLGTPSEKIWTGYSKLPAPQKMKFVEFPVSNLRTKFPREMLSDKGLDLLKRLLTYDPRKRISCEEALNHDYFYETPLPIDPSMFPTWPAKSEGGGGGGTKAASPKPPSGGGAFKKINDEDDDSKLAASSSSSASAAVAAAAAAAAAAGAAATGGFALKFGAAAPEAWNLKF